MRWIKQENEIIIEDSHKFNQEIINNNKFYSLKKNQINPNIPEKIKPNNNKNNEPYMNLVESTNNTNNNNNIPLARNIINKDFQDYSCNKNILNQNINNTIPTST